MFDYIIEMVFYYSNKVMWDFIEEGYVILLIEGCEILLIERFVIIMNVWL